MQKHIAQNKWVIKIYAAKNKHGTFFIQPLLLCYAKFISPQIPFQN